jgi:hypothetical protein
MDHRSLRSIILFASALIFLAPALARADGGVDHVTLMEGDLAPSGSRTYQLKFGEGDLRQGWLFGLVGQIHAGAADLTLLDPSGKPAAQWHWETTDTPRWDGIAIPRDGAYSLRVANTAAAALRYTLYYDQSCFCAGKKLPLEGGVVIFQGSASAGAPVETWLALPKDMEASVQLAYRSTPAGRWPADYRLLPVTPHLDTQNSDNYRQESITFTAASADPYYVIVQSHKGIGGINFLTQEGSEGGGVALVHNAPAGPPWLLLVAAFAAAVAVLALALAAGMWLRRQRSTD